MARALTKVRVSMWVTRPETAFRNPESCLYRKTLLILITNFSLFIRFSSALKMPSSFTFFAGLYDYVSNKPNFT